MLCLTRTASEIEASYKKDKTKRKEGTQAQVVGPTPVLAHPPEEVAPNAAPATQVEATNAPTPTQPLQAGSKAPEIARRTPLDPVKDAPELSRQQSRRSPWQWPTFKRSKPAADRKQLASASQNVSSERPEEQIDGQRPVDAQSTQPETAGTATKVTSESAPRANAASLTLPQPGAPGKPETAIATTRSFESKPSEEAAEPEFHAASPDVEVKTPAQIGEIPRLGLGCIFTTPSPDDLKANAPSAAERFERDMAGLKWVKSLVEVAPLDGSKRIELLNLARDFEDFTAISTASKEDPDAAVRSAAHAILSELNIEQLTATAVAAENIEALTPQVAPIVEASIESREVAAAPEAHNTAATPLPEIRWTDDLGLQQAPSDAKKRVELLGLARDLDQIEVLIRAMSEDPDETVRNTARSYAAAA
jgi:hypothetical protein